jgi:hypothetical protein
LLVTVEVQVPAKLEGEALVALQKYAEVVAEKDVRAELKSKAIQ